MYTFLSKACTTLACCLCTLAIVVSDVCWAFCSCSSSFFNSSLVAARLVLLDASWDYTKGSKACKTLHHHNCSDSKGLHVYIIPTTTKPWLYSCSSLTPRLLPSFMSHTAQKAGREPGRFDHMRGDVLCMVLCVVWVIKLPPMHAVFEHITGYA